MAVTKIGQYKNLLAVFRRISSDEGPGGMYRGFCPTMMGVVVYAGTSFFTYESLKTVWSEYRLTLEQDPNPSPVERLFSGAVAGLVGQTSSYPLDIVRRRMQTARQMGLAPNRYATVIGTLVLVYQKEGFFRGWYKGITMNFIKGPIATAISFTSFDYFQVGLRKIVIGLAPKGHQEC